MLAVYEQSITGELSPSWQSSLAVSDAMDISGWISQLVALKQVLLIPRPDSDQVFHRCWLQAPGLLPHTPSLLWNWHTCNSSPHQHHSISTSVFQSLIASSTLLLRCEYRLLCYVYITYYTPKNTVFSLPATDRATSSCSSACLPQLPAPPDLLRFPSTLFSINQSTVPSVELCIWIHQPVASWSILTGPWSPTKGHYSQLATCWSHNHTLHSL